MGYRSSGYGTTEKVYDFLLEYIDKNGFAPSVREIGEEVGLKSTSSVVYHLSTLEEEGRIEVRENSPRAIKVVGYNYTKEGSDMEDIKGSDLIKEETINNVIADLKKEVPLLSETEIQRIRDAFYSGTEKYLFKRKKE